MNPPNSLNVTHETTVDVPSAESNRGFVMLYTDWRRVKQRLKELPDETSETSAWYATAWGISATAFTSVIPLCFATGLPNWVAPAYVMLALGTLVLGLYWFNDCQEKRKRVKTRAQLITDELDEIQNRCKSIASE